MKNLILLIPIFSFISCNNCPSVYSYRSFEFTNDVLEVGTLGQVGMDSLKVTMKYTGNLLHFLLKDIGDAILGSFQGAYDAVTCAVENPYLNTSSNDHVK